MCDRFYPKELAYFSPSDATLTPKKILDTQ